VQRGLIEIDFLSLDIGAERLSDLAAILSFDERDRASRFRFDLHRNRFIACRAMLRERLAEKLNIAPSAMQFIYGDHGKPGLSGHELQFNVSHSHNMAMIAISESMEVGCDIERIDPSFADEQIPERFFSSYEVATLRALPVADQCEAFFRCWTRKEAYIKACGMGVSLGLDTFDVTLAPDQGAALLRGADGWTLKAVDAPEGYAAAVVARGDDWSIKLK
jgi:4'-phosphopantetheinyl transferase